MESHMEKGSNIHKQIEKWVVQSREDIYKYITDHPMQIAQCMDLIQKYDIVLNEDGKLVGYTIADMVKLYGTGGEADGNI